MADSVRRPQMFSFTASDPVDLPLALLTPVIRAHLRVHLTTWVVPQVPRLTASPAAPEAPTAFRRDTRGRTTGPHCRRTILLRRPFLR